MSTYTLRLTPGQLREACKFWTWGCPFFGAWAVKQFDHLTVRQYGELVALVRRELNDTTDYSKEETR